MTRLKKKGHSRLNKKEVFKYTKLLFVWLLIMLLALAGSFLLYFKDNFRRVEVSPEEGSYADGVLEIKSSSMLSKVFPLNEWVVYDNCSSYEDYLKIPETESKLVDVYNNKDASIVKGRTAQNKAYVLKIKNSSEYKELLVTMALPAINSASWIFINGKYVQGAGDIGENYHEFAINQTLKLRIEKTIEIVILVENRSMAEGGLVAIPVIARDPVIIGFQNNYYIISLLIILYAIIVAIVGIWVFVTSKDKTYLWFALLCLAFVVAVSEPLFRAVGSTMITTKTVIFNVAYIMLGMYLVLFCSSLISKERIAKISQVCAIGFNAVSLILAIFVMPFTNKVNQGIYNYIDVIAFTNMLYLWFYAMISYFRTGKKFLMFTTVSVMIESMLFEGVISNSYIPMYTFSPVDWGYAFIVIAISFNVFRQLNIISKREAQYSENINNEVYKRTQKIEALLQEKKEFTSMVAHDLKAPLASVKMMLNEVDAPRLSIDKMDELINAIDLKVMSMTENLKTLQNFNAMDMKNEEYQIVEIGTFLDNIYKFIVADANAEGILLNYKRLKRKINVRVPVKKLTKAFENIIYNAISFCKEDDSIDIKYRQSENNIVISVLDSGCGIAPQSLPHIFEKFYSDRSSNNPEKAVFKGDGLGLYFVKLLTEEIGGSVSANSWVDIGTEIIVSIPIYESENHTEIS